MSISSSVSRFTDYFRRNGLWATLRRLRVATRRSLFSSRSVLFYCDLSTLKPVTSDLPSSLKVERYASQSGLSHADQQEIINVWNPEQARRNLKERFGLGASIWLIKSEDHLAGYGWTLQGRTVEPHYFPLAPDDVHLFDFHVFPQYRGRGVNPLLVSQILHKLSIECRGRAFIEAAEWNQAQLASLRRTPFHRLGLGRRLAIFGRATVCWDPRQAIEQECEPMERQYDAVGGRKRSGLPDMRA
jgi:ribosomal protein S18 acetylase RimI-like enzyme